MASSSQIYPIEVRNGLFKIRWELKEDIKGKGKRVCSRKKCRNLKQNLIVKYVSQEELKRNIEETTDEDSSSSSDEDNENENDHEGISGNNNMHAENEPEKQTSNSSPHPLKNKICPVHMWTHTSEYGAGIDRKLLKNDADEWRVEWYSYKLPDYINLWIDFGTLSPIERNAIKTMSGLASMFYDQHRCDVQFRFKDEKSIGAHILILSVGSPVFSAMFQSGLLESQTREVTITDIKLETFVKLLDYLYTGSAPKLEDEKIIQLLFEAADKYAIENLKNDCLEALQERVRLDNVVNLLVWSHFHSTEPLFETAMKFTVKHFRKLIVQADFEAFLKKLPDLCLMVMKRVASLRCRVCDRDDTTTSTDTSP